uniref:Sugar phosphate isomerase/epimerase n=1 Tax=Thermofilum pendens TaxID=2269 RepID=A0A7C4FAP3_THEPE
MLAVQAKVKGVEAAVKLPWRVSIVGFMANPRVLQGDLEAVKETFRTLTSDSFFDIIEVQPLPEEAWSVAKSIADQRGVEIALGLQPYVLTRGVNPSTLDEDARRKSVATILEEVRKARERGVTKVAFCSGPDPGPADRGAAMDALVKSLREICAASQKLGVTVILETFDRDWDRKQLIGPIAEAVKVAEQVREEYGNFGLLWDLSHGPLLNETPSALKTAEEYLVHVHIGCAKRLPEGRLVDWHPGFYRPGAINGVEEVRELLKVLLEIGYRGIIGFEVKPEEGQHWLEPVMSAKGVLYTAFSQLVESW